MIFFLKFPIPTHRVLLFGNDLGAFFTCFPSYAILNAPKICSWIGLEKTPSDIQGNSIDASRTIENERHAETLNIRSNSTKEQKDLEVNGRTGDKEVEVEKYLQD